MRGTHRAKKSGINGTSLIGTLNNLRGALNALIKSPSNLSQRHTLPRSTAPHPLTTTDALVTLRRSCIRAIYELDESLFALKSHILANHQRCLANEIQESIEHFVFCILTGEYAMLQHTVLGASIELKVQITDLILELREITVVESEHSVA